MHKCTYVAESVFTCAVQAGGGYIERMKRELCWVQNAEYYIYSQCCRKCGGGQTESFQNVGGGAKVYTMY